MSVTRKKTLELKEYIYQLYCVEGKSLNYISNLFHIQRKEMTEIIKNEFNFKSAQIKQTTIRIKKLINQHKGNLLNFMKNTTELKLTSILNTIGINNSTFRTMCNNDVELENARIEFNERESQRAIKDKSRIERESNWLSECLNNQNEIWKDILGYEGRYKISNYGRIKSIISAPRIITAHLNKIHNRYEISLVDSLGKKKSHKRYRLLAHTFLNNPDPINMTTINHKDGDSTNDELSNLEWSSQKYQNWHKNEVLKRNKPKGYGKNGIFKGVIIDGTFTFKTIRAAAKFLNVSETQIQRYISGETKFNRTIELIY